VPLTEKFAKQKTLFWQLPMLAFSQN